jgi:hypothetical protein
MLATNHMFRQDEPRNRGADRQYAGAILGSAGWRASRLKILLSKCQKQYEENSLVVFYSWLQGDIFID